MPSLGIIVVGLAAPLGRAAFLAAGVALIVLLVGFVLTLRHHPALLIGGFLGWLSIERFAIAALSPGLDPETLPMMLGYKELFFPLLAVVLLPAAPRAWREGPRALRVVDGLAIAFGVLILLSFLLSPAPLLDRLIYARRLALLPLVYGVGRLLPWRLESLRCVIGLLVGASVVIAAFGLLELFAAGDLIWREWVPAAYYYHLSSLGGLSAEGTDFPKFGLPVPFFDFTSGIPERRLVSTFLEATTLASFLAFATIVTVAAVRPRRAAIASAAVIGLAGFLTLGKAGWLILGVGVGYVIVVSFIPRMREPAWLGSLAAGLIGALAVISVALEASESATGALRHFEGLRQGIAAVVGTPLGSGLGIGGNFGVGTLAAESTFGVIMVQIGLIGLLVWAAWMLGVAFACATVGRRLGAEPLLGPALGAAVIAFFATAAFTESAGGFLGSWMYALLPAALLTVAIRRSAPHSDIAW